MSIKDAAWLGQYLSSGKRVLIMAGALCDQLELEDKSLLDYVADMSKKMKAPVAATGNTVNGLRERGIDTNKAWAAEMVNFMRWDWQNPIRVPVRDRKSTATVSIRILGLRLDQHPILRWVFHH